jgi:hypothetical protein
MRNKGKNIFLVFGVAISLCFTDMYNSPKPGQGNIPANIARKIRRDAARLALRIEGEREDLRYQSVGIPKDRLNGIYNILSNIYSMDEVGKSIEKCNIHTFPNPSIDHIVLIFNKTADWAEPLRNGANETNHKDINKLLSTYDLVIEKYVQWNDKSDAITIRSKEPLNMAALANEFNNINDVTEVDLGLPKVGGSDIRMKRIDNAWELEYVLTFGAYAGMTSGKQHFWKYKALDSGKVSFVAEGGDPIPAWIKCAYDDPSLLNKRI